MDKPKILHILAGAGPDYTAIVKVVAIIARELRDKYAFSAWFLLQDGPLRADLEQVGVSTAFVPWVPSPRDPLGAIRFWFALRKSKFDLIDQHFGGLRVRKLVRKVSAVPIVLHVHARVDEADPHTPVNIRTCDTNATIANSNAVAQFAHGAQVVHCGIDVEIDRQPLTHDKNQLGIGTAGRLIPLKRVTDLIEAISGLQSQFPNVRLQVAGDGPERARLMECANKFNVADRLEFLGWQAGIQSVMRQWDVYVHPSAEEGFGMAIVEAMACGLPVIATRVGGVPEIVEDGKSGFLVDMGRPDLLAEKIELLLRDRGLRIRMGERGQQIVATRFTAKRMADEVAAVYEAVLASR